MTRLEEEDNKYLFCYMKDNETWYSEYDNFINRVRYFNPLSASYYGLQFHSNKKWLDEVSIKVQKHFRRAGLQLIIAALEIEPDKEYCFQVFVINKIENKPLLESMLKHNMAEVPIYHSHDKNLLVGYRKMLVQLVKDITFKYN